MNFQAAIVLCRLYWMKPSLRNRFMKKLTLERVVPTISASVSWLIFGNHQFGFAFLPEIGQQQQHPRQPLFAGVEELVHQILFNSNVAGEQMVQQQLGKGRLVMKQTDHACFFQPHNRTFRHCGGAGHTQGLAGQASLAKEIAGAQEWRPPLPCPVWRPP